jgi:hypothetical protein
MERVEELEVATWWTTKSSSPNRTEFLVGYKKRPDEPYLVLTRSWLNPTVMCPEVSPSFEPKPSQQLSRRHANLDGSSQLCLQTAPEYLTELRHVWLLRDVPPAVRRRLAASFAR